MAEQFQRYGRRGAMTIFATAAALFWGLAIGDAGGSEPPGSGPGQAPGLKRLAVPDEAALGQSLEIAQEIYRPEYHKAQTPAARSALARKVLQKAAESQDDRVAQFVLLRLGGTSPSRPPIPRPPLRPSTAWRRPLRSTPWP